MIGALHYETQVAQAVAEQVGMSTLSAAEMTPQAFSTIALAYEHLHYLGHDIVHFPE